MSDYSKSEMQENLLNGSYDISNHGIPSTVTTCGG